MAKDLTSAIQDLTSNASGQSSRKDKTLTPAPSPTETSSRSGSSGPVNAAGGSIASPLTESNFSLREFHAAGWKTTDGFITLPAIKKIVMTDNSGAAVIFNFAAPI